MKNLLIFAIPVLLQSCGPYTHTEYYVHEKDVNIDGVKLISSSIVQEDDSRTMKQDVYEISPEQRLLLRREDLTEKKDTIYIKETNPALLTLTLVDESQMASGLSNLKLCAVSKNWMMLATWYKAHPFGGNGQWGVPGADYVKETCIQAVQVPDTLNKIRFDVGELLSVRLTGMREAFGWILLSEQESIKIFGDNDPENFPRLFWSERYSQTITEPGFPY